MAARALAQDHFGFAEDGNPKRPDRAGLAEGAKPKRPPRGLLSEPLWRVMADLHAVAGPDGLSDQRHSGGWPWLAEQRRGRGADPFVTDRRLADGRRDPDMRRWLTEAGRAHIAAHAERYPHVALREPGQVAAEPLPESDDWRLLVDIATGVLAAPDTPIPAVYEDGGWSGQSRRRVRAYLDRLRDRGLVTVTEEGRRVLTEAGRRHYTAHRADYARRWPDIHAPDLSDLTTPARDETCPP